MSHASVSLVKNVASYNQMSQTTDTSVFLTDNQTVYESPSPFAFTALDGDVIEKVIVNDLNRVAMSIRLATMVTQFQATKSDLTKKEALLIYVGQLLTPDLENPLEVKLIYFS